jgi:C4-dicarboxylate-specific signal transduction histidine kinase
MSAEYRYFHPRDGERWIQHSVRVLRRGADGKETLSLAVSRDVTDGKHAEIETQKLRTALTHSHRVSLLGQLVAALAHELNQPLAAILANTQAAQRFLAGDGADPGEIAGILDDIVRDDKRAGNILHNLRALVSKRPPARRACCLNEVVRQVVEMTRGEMILRGIDTRVALAPGPAAVEGVCVELQQVVMNLLLNAAQAVAGSPPGGRTVEIETRCAEGEAVVVIRDRGPGIPPDRMPRIFELFYSTKEDGLGAGLAIVRRIVTDHGGCVAARNHEAGGAEFTVVLPVARTSPGP